MGGALGVVAVVVAAGRSAGMRVRAAAAADRDLRAMPGACLLRDARRLGINWSNSLDLPMMMRGIGNNVVLPVGLATVTIQIQDVLEKVDALIVEGNIIKYPVLIGHSFTERPGIIITKTYDSLIFTRELTNKLHLELVSDTSIRAKEMCLVEVSSTSDYSGPVYVRGSLRGKSGHEFYLLPGEYELDNGRGRLLILNISDKVVLLKKQSLITRALKTNDCAN
ncbi:hypothetical protein HF086_014751, partial [Spodoptera exigua]